MATCGSTMKLLVLLFMMAAVTPILAGETAPGPAESPAVAGDVPLSSWQGALMPIIGKLSLLDLTLPGTHDTLAYDLDTKTSAGAIDDHENISLLLRYLPFARLVAGSWIRTLALAQYRTITEQLDDGLRFLDLRLMQEPISKEWRSLHWVQSNQLFTSYLKEIRAWLDAHPTEVITMILSRHGQKCATGEVQYPKVSIADKRRMWKTFLQIFDGLVMDTSISSIGTTPMADLIRRNHRVVVFVSDREEFTDSSVFALDLCHDIASNGVGAPDNIPGEQASFESLAKSAATRNKLDRRNNHMTFLRLSAPPTDWHVKHLAWIKYWPFGREKEEAACCEAFGIPSMTRCPRNLLEMTTLNNYYHQRGMAMLLNDKSMRLDLPAAVTIDQYGPSGTMTVSPGSTRKVSAFADIILTVVVRRACLPNGPHFSQAAADPAACEAALKSLRQRTDRYPQQVWEDPASGRHTAWP